MSCKAFQLVERFVFETSTRRLVAVVIAIMVVRTGIWCIPNLEQSRAIAADPFVNPLSDPLAQYLYWTWLGPFLAWLVGAQSSVGFFLFYLAFSIGFTSLFVWIALSRFPNHLARAAIILFAVLPVSATAYFWVGYDSLTLFLLLLGVAYQQYAFVTLVTGVGLGMHHFEQGALAAAGLLIANGLRRVEGQPGVRYDQGLLRTSGSGHSIRFPLLLLLGAIVGKLILIGLFTHFAAAVNSGRWLYVSDSRLTVRAFAFHAHYAVWSILGLGWLVALRYLDLGRQALPFFVALFCLLLLLPVSGDQTRIVGIITFPLIAEYWLLNQDFLKQLARREIAVIFTAWVLLPWGWTWNGIPMWSVFPYDIAYVLHMLVGWPAVPANPSLWPFQ